MEITKQQIKVGLIGLILIFGLIAGIYRFSLRDYEEVCIKYQMNVTADLNYCHNYPTKTCINESNCFFYYNNTYEQCSYNHRYIPTDNCIEYQLVRKVNIKSFVYLFDWCMVYPNSEDCKNATSKTEDKWRVSLG